MNLKKIIVAIVSAFIMVITLLGATTTTASAADCTWRQGTLPISTYMSNVYGTTHQWHGTFGYKACGSYARILSVEYYINTGGDAEKCGYVPGGTHHIKEYRFNINAIGDWNPWMKTWNCNPDRDVYYVYKSAPDGTFVYPSDPAEKRCVAANVTVITSGDFDLRRSSDSKCINFSR